MPRHQPLSGQQLLEEKSSVSSYGEASAQTPKKKKGGTIPSSVFNLMNMVLGAGVLTLPYAIKSCGVVLGLLILAYIGILSTISMYELDWCSERVGKYLYKDIARHSFGRWAAPLVDIFIAINTCGTCIAYTIIIGKYIAPITSYFLPQPFYWRVISCIGALVYLPLCLFRNLEKLKYTSFVAIVFVFFTCGLLVEQVIEHASHLAVVPFFRWSLDIFNATPLLTVSFNCHYNIQRLYHELVPRRLNRMSVVIYVSAAACCFVYGLAGVSGFLLFGESTSGNILNDFPSGFFFANIARLGIAFTIIFSYPLVNFALRGSLMNIFFPNKPFSRVRWVVMTLILIALCLGIGVLAGDISIVLQFSGSIAVTLIVFVFPALLHIRIDPHRWYSPYKYCDYLILVSSALFMVLGIRSAILRCLGHS